VSNLVIQDLAKENAEREKKLVLVVDSDSAHLYFTSMLLQRLDYSIQTAKNADDALEMITVARPALVLTELALPESGGLEFIRAIKRHPRTYSVRVMVLAAGLNAATREACLAEGCAAALAKPVDPDALYAAVQKATESQPRSFIRLNTCLNILIGKDVNPANAVIDDYISALSENGMFVSTANPRAVGLEFPFTIFLKDAIIKVTGVVLYSFQRGQGPLRTPGMGIRFTQIDPEEQAMIRTFIRREITKGLTMGQIGGTIM
jgi:CheY-like chemotaxis protein/Tfp pilus assembly protein PilZ